MIEAQSIGVVGAGRMGELHARAIKEHPQLTLRGIVDIDESRANALADRFNSDAFTDHSELYHQPLDGVVVATPESSHGPPVRDATECGYDILLEKPISDDKEESGELAKQCRSADIDVLMGFILRFDTRYGELKRRVEDGEFGKVVGMRAERSVVIEEARRMQRSHPLLYQTIHDIDFMCWLKDKPVDRVFAEATRNVFAGEDVTDIVFSTLRFADGAIASIETSSILPAASPADNQANFHLKGTNGMARLTAPGAEVSVTTNDHKTPDTDLFTEVNGQLAGSIAREIDHFSAVVRNEATPVATLTDAERAEAIAHATIAAIESGEPKKVEQPQGSEGLPYE